MLACSWFSADLLSAVISLDSVSHFKSLSAGLVVAGSSSSGAYIGDDSCSCSSWQPVDGRIDIPDTQIPFSIAVPFSIAASRGQGFALGVLLQFNHTEHCAILHP